ncbi:DUF5129 domain-containing protein [Actinomyces trachealis]|uniref:DUF5129 domain-containing protein n=1 Tax=Actinomyces trachealis TaxID=2763540 RepID=UPI0018929DB4|nr:DUF5129 domain-containing protein [Actinomyces trachealis]
MAESILLKAGGARAVFSLAAKTLVAMVLVAVVPLLLFWPFGRTHAPAVEVHDEAGVLQPAATAQALEELRFRKNVRLVVLTLDVGYNDSFNNAVLAHARAHAPSWVDGNYWADGMVILGVSPGGRWVGCYFGEDVKVGTATQQAIQEAGKGSFRQGLWATGVEQMARKSSVVIGRPVAGETTVWLLSGLGVSGGLGWLGWMLWSASAARSTFRRAKRHYTQVTSDYEGTQIKAGLIPTNEAHGAQVLARFGWFEDQYARLTRAFQEYGEPHGALWFGNQRRSTAKQLLSSATALDSLDDAISNAAALLTLSEGWEVAWANEQGPVREDLASLLELCAQVESNGQVQATSERQWAHESQNRLAQLANLLATRQVTPSDALTELDTIATLVRSRADSLANRALQASTRYREERLKQYRKSQGSGGLSSSPGYRGSWSYGGHRSSYNPSATIRINPGSPGASASGVRWTGAGAASQFSAPVASLVTGYGSAASWAPPSSSSGSSFSGGFSGGGFSGAGSSSHF